MNERKNLKKKLEKETEDTCDIDEESDLPVHERYTKEKNIKKYKKE